MKTSGLRLSAPNIPGLPGGGTVYMTYVHQGVFDSVLQNVLYQNVVDRADVIDAAENTATGRPSSSAMAASVLSTRAIPTTRSRIPPAPW